MVSFIPHYFTPFYTHHLSVDMYPQIMDINFHIRLYIYPYLDDGVSNMRQYLT
jgi:hypothetical protein